MRFAPYRFGLPVCVLALIICFGLAACSTSGHSFHTTDLGRIQVGQTTLEQASRILDAEPVNVYRQLDGSALAIWSHKATLLTDAIYARQELWLAFGSDGKFIRVVNSTNVSTQTMPQSPPAAVAPMQNVQRKPDPLGSLSNTPAYEPAVTYSLQQ
ncbi:MAG: hypothetical protein ABI155_12105 [Paralcaligenes sp.]